MVIDGVLMSMVIVLICGIIDDYIISIYFYNHIGYGNALHLAFKKMIDTSPSSIRVFFIIVLSIAWLIIFNTPTEE